MAARFYLLREPLSIRLCLLSASRTRAAYLLGSVHSVALAAKSIAIRARSPIASGNFTTWRAVLVVVIASFTRWLFGFVGGMVARHGVLPHRQL